MTAREIIERRFQTISRYFKGRKYAVSGGEFTVLDVEHIDQNAAHCSYPIVVLFVNYEGSLKEDRLVAFRKKIKMISLLYFQQKDIQVQWTNPEQAVYACINRLYEHMQETHIIEMDRTFPLQEVFRATEALSKHWVHSTYVACFEDFSDLFNNVRADFDSVIERLQSKLAEGVYLRWQIVKNRKRKF